jgi:ABC-type enterochelin transport system permease subunit
MLAGLCTWIARGPFTHCIRLSVGISEVATENLKQVKRKEQTLAKGTLGDHIYIYICYVSNSHEVPGEIMYITWTARLVEPNHERTVNSHQQLHLKVSTITLAQNLCNASPNNMNNWIQTDDQVILDQSIKLVYILISCQVHESISSINLLKYIEQSIQHPSKTHP